MALWWADKGLCLAALPPEGWCPAGRSLKEPVHDCISV